MCASHTRRMHAGKLATLIIRGAPEITYGRAIRASRTIFIKINRLTFEHPKYENHEPECAGKDSHCHTQRELRISRYDQRNPYHLCTSGRLHLASWGGVTSKNSLVLVYFGLIKLKPKQNTSVFPTYFTC